MAIFEPSMISINQMHSNSIGCCNWMRSVLNRFYSIWRTLLSHGIGLGLTTTTRTICCSWTFLMRITWQMIKCKWASYIIAISVFFFKWFDRCKSATIEIYRATLAIAWVRNFTHSLQFQKIRACSLTTITFRMRNRLTDQFSQWTMRLILNKLMHLIRIRIIRTNAVSCNTSSKFHR